MSLSRKDLFLIGGAATIVLWLLSFIAFTQPLLQLILAILFILAFAYCAFTAYPWALTILFFEVIIGNKGSLFSFPFFDTAVALRLILFAILFLAWFMHALRQKKLLLLRRTPYFWPWIGLLIMISSGILIGFLYNSTSLVYFDANGYLFFLVFLPLSLVFAESSWWQKLKYILLGATTAIAVLTITFSLLFTVLMQSDQFTKATTISDEQVLALQKGTTGEGRLVQTTALSTEKILLNENEGGGMSAIYRWMQDTGNGEISYIGSGFFRIFLTSHLFVFLTALFLFARISWTRFWERGSRSITVLFLIHVAAMAVSFSRSLWLAFILSGFILILLLPRERRLRVLLSLVLFVVLFMCGAALIFPELGSVFVERMQSIFRPSEELATSTRLSLLPPLWARIQEHLFFGSGFGTTISYLVPIAGTDVVETVRAYLFEWAYLDLMVKTGLFGLAIFLTFLGVGLREGIRVFKVHRGPEEIAVFAGLLFLIITNLTTPYLNHPIGIAALLLLLGYLITAVEPVVHE